MCVCGRGVNGLVGKVCEGVVAGAGVCPSVAGDDNPERTAALRLLVVLQLIVCSVLFFNDARLGMVTPACRKVFPVCSIIFSISLSPSSPSESSLSSAPSSWGMWSC